MPVKLTNELRERIKEATRRIDAGEISYDKLKDELGVGVATVYRCHVGRLEEDVNRLRKDLDTVSHTYKETVKRLYAERDQLKEEIATLTQQKEELAHIFKDRNLTWQDGLELLKDVSDLRFERVRVQKELEGYKQLIQNEKRELDETERTVKRLRAVEKKEQQMVKKLSEQRSAYLGWLQLEAPILEERRRELKAEVDALESTKQRLEKEFKTFLGIE